MANVYLAAPFGEKNSEKRRNAEIAASILEKRGFSVYRPWTIFIPDAWDLPNAVWGRKVFENDKAAIDAADIVVTLSYGRCSTTAGTNWEAGYAYGTGKKLIVVEMTDETMSLMVSNGCHAVLSGMEELQTYDFSHSERRKTETEVNNDR